MENSVLTAIAQYGFPIVMCLLVWFQNNKTVEKLTELVEKVSVRLSNIESDIEDIKESIDD